MAIEELTSPPGAATLYPRAVAGATVVPLLRRLPGLSKPAGLPDTELRLDAAEIDRERLAAYARICGFPLRDTLPAPYPHLLAFPLGLRLMTAPAFPLPAIGLVHVANAITQLRPIDARERLDVRVRAADLRSHPRGTQFEMVAEAHAGGERAWISVSTYLRREGGHGSKRDRDTDPPRPSARWEVPGDTGRRYAAVSARPQPDPPPPLQRAAVRDARGDRARDVAQGALPGRAGPRAPGRVHRRRALQAARRASRAARLLDLRGRGRPDLRAP